MRSPQNHQSITWMVLITLPLALHQLSSIVSAVNIDKYQQLSRDDFLELDQQVSDYYLENYGALSAKNVSYDDYLFISIRSIRHTVVLHQLDYMYDNPDVMRKSQGSLVGLPNCQQDLDLLVQFSKRFANRSSTHDDDNLLLPIEAINFLESYGRTEAGVLNGNFIWWGSPSSCSRARISADSISRYLSSVQLEPQPPKAAHKTAAQSIESGIKGRYCVGHLRAQSWTKSDKYFGDRISIKLGLCLPESCHSLQFVESDSVRRQVDYLARSNLLAPFNGNRYYTSYLYCQPDEDSELRQWDLGTCLFCLFAACWLLLLVYTNHKYHQREVLMQKLRDSVDIRMIINQKKRQSFQQDDDDYSDDSVNDTGHVGVDDDSKLTAEVDTIPAKASPSPVKRRNFATEIGQKSTSQLDFFRAFSLQANLSYLFHLTPASSSTNQKSQRNQSNLSDGSPGRSKRDGCKNLSQQSSSVSRRTSASNEALIKEIQMQPASSKRANLTYVSDKTPPVQIVAPPERESKRKRVDVDILDGIKVIATTYIVVGHTMMFFFGSVHDMRFADERMFDYTMLALINSLQVVGLFYIITGTLFSYLAFSRAKPKQLVQPLFWLLVMVGRYIRLLPSYLLVFWFARHVAPFTGAGPYWQDYRTDSQHNRGYCASESWWQMLSLSAADVKIPRDCLPQAWYLSNDFRTLLVLPFYVVALAYNRTAGYVAILSTVVLSSLNLVSILKTTNINYQIIFYWQPHVYSLMADRLHDVYTNVSVRLSTYLLGIVVGHLLYLYESRQIKSWPTWLRRWGLKFALVTGGLFFMGAKVLSTPYVSQLLPGRDNVDSDTAVIMIPLFKLAMELCICTVLLLMVTGGGYNWAASLLTSKTFRILSRISYCVFLVHIEVMYKTPAFKIESSYWYLLVYATYFIVMSNIVAFLMSVLYEMPSTIFCATYCAELWS